MKFSAGVQNQLSTVSTLTPSDAIALKAIIAVAGPPQTPNGTAHRHSTMVHVARRTKRSTAYCHNNSSGAEQEQELQCPDPSHSPGSIPTLERARHVTLSSVPSAHRAAQPRTRAIRGLFLAVSALAREGHPKASHDLEPTQAFPSVFTHALASDPTPLAPTRRIARQSQSVSTQAGLTRQATHVKSAIRSPPPPPTTV